MAPYTVVVVPAFAARLPTRTGPMPRNSFRLSIHAFLEIACAADAIQRLQFAGRVAYHDVIEVCRKVSIVWVAPSRFNAWMTK